MPNKLSFYLDENVETVVAAQLRLREIEVVTVLDLGLLGDSDANHLARATRMGYILCSYDRDYLRLANEGVEHAGLVMGQRRKHEVGDWVRGLVRLHATHIPSDFVNRIEFL